MKRLLKLIGGMMIFLVIAVAGYVIVFSLDTKYGLIAGFLMILLFFILFCLSIFGLVIGNLKWIKLNNRLEVFGLLGATIGLTVFIDLITFGNAVIEFASSNLTLEEKTKFIASTAFQLPVQKGLDQEMINGTKYLFPAELKETAHHFDDFLTKEKASFDELLGSNDLDQFTIEIYDESDVLNENALVDNVAGYYNRLNRTIHVYYNDDRWKHTLLHEYAHYRIHQFATAQKLDVVDRIPQGFEEGLCELIAYRNMTYHVPELDEVIDFHLMDSNVDFQEIASSDEYKQSYFAVQSIVNAHGLEAIPELLHSKTPDEFYVNLERITKKNLAEFQHSFLDELIADRDETEKKFALISELISIENYEQAETIINEIIEKENGYIFDRSQAIDNQLRIYLNQSLFQEANPLIENKISSEGIENNIHYLIEQAKVYLFS